MAMSKPIKLELLSKGNYRKWRVNVRELLSEYGLWGYVTGEILRPSKIIYEAAFKEWLKNDGKAKAFIISALKPEDMVHVKNCKTSRVMWKKLEDIYQSREHERDGVILRGMLFEHMKEGDEMKPHVKKFFKVARRLDHIDMGLNDELLKAILLHSLPRSYEAFRNVILDNRGPKPSLKQVKLKILEESEAREFDTQRNVRDTDDIKKWLRDGFVLKNEYDSDEETVQCSSCCLDKSDEARGSGFFSSLFGGTTERTAELEEILQQDFNVQSGEIELRIRRPRRRAPDFENSGTDESTMPGEAGPSNAATDFESYTPMARVNEMGSLVYARSVPDLLSSIHSSSSDGSGFTFRRNSLGNELSDISLSSPINHPNLSADGDGNQANDTTDTEESDDKTQLKWHRRLAHLGFSDMYRVAGNLEARNDFDEDDRAPDCEGCSKGQKLNRRFPPEPRLLCTLMELIHSDVYGPVDMDSLSKSKYFVTFIDDCSRWCEVYFIKKKSEVLDKFIEFVNNMERMTHRKVRYLQSSFDAEYLNSKFNRYLRKNNIFRLNILPPRDQNEIAQRKNMLLMDHARCMMAQVQLPEKFWAEAVGVANYVLNRCPNRHLEMRKSPFEVVFKKAPFLGYMREFGCEAYMRERTHYGVKFVPDTPKMIFIGYPNESQGYRLYDPARDKIHIATDIYVKETNEEYESISIITSNRKKERKTYGRYKAVQLEALNVKEELKLTVLESDEDIDSDSDSSAYKGESPAKLSGSSCGRTSRTRRFFGCRRNFGFRRTMRMCADFSIFRKICGSGDNQ